MSNSVDKSASRAISVQQIVFFEMLWAFLAFLFFLLFGPYATQATRDTDAFFYWFYNLGTSFFEIGAFLVAALLCLRNAFSPQIVSGRQVWTGIGLGMLFYAIGGVLFTYWETILGREADISPGDVFYLATYLSLGYGMVMAVIDRRLNLEFSQWLIVITIGAIGVALAIWVSLNADKASNSEARLQEWLAPPAIALPAPPDPGRSIFTLAQAPASKPSPTAPATKVQKATTPKAIAVPTPPAPPEPTKGEVTPSPTSSPSSSPEATPTTPHRRHKKPIPAPGWVLAIESFLGQFKQAINLFYIIADVFLLIIATTLLLAFWGGRFALSWRMIAFAAFWLYVADMWFKYAQSLPNYKSGSLPEVGWVFSGVLFGVGAALEYDLSKSRRAGRRRGAT